MGSADGYVADMLLALGQHGLADGLYRIRLGSVFMLDEGALIARWDLEDAPGFVYEERYDPDADN